MSTDPNGPIDLEEFLSMAVELLTLNGDAREVALLVGGEVSLEEAEEQGFGGLAEYYIKIKVPSAVYLGLSSFEQNTISIVISRFARPCGQYLGRMRCLG
jgi:hypothetical protein